MKIAIIGFGGMAGHHKNITIPRLNDSDYPQKLEIAGIYDIDEERNKIAKELGLHVFNSPQEIYDDKSIDIVLITTPNDFHLPYVLESLQNGKHVICEKPLALSSKEVLRLWRKLRGGNNILRCFARRKRMNGTI